MNCPSCHTSLVNSQGYQLSLCTQCSGIFFYKNALGIYLKNYFQTHIQNGEVPIEFDRRVMPWKELKDNEGDMLCPVCLLRMDAVNYLYDSNIIIHSCSKCDGVWVEQEKIPQLAQHIKGNTLLQRTGEAIIEATQQRRGFLVCIVGVFALMFAWSIVETTILWIETPAKTIGTVVGSWVNTHTIMGGSRGILLRTHFRSPIVRFLAHSLSGEQYTVTLRSNALYRDQGVIPLQLPVRYNPNHLEISEVDSFLRIDNTGTDLIFFIPTFVMFLYLFRLWLKERNSARN